MATLWSDLRYGLRLLRHAPGFTAVAVGALALGIGANTAIFSTVDAVLLRPLPFADPDRVVMVWEDATFAGFPRNTPAPANFVDWKKRNHVFSDMAATRGASANLTADGPPEQVMGRATTANFFDVLGRKTHRRPRIHRRRGSHRRARRDHQLRALAAALRRDPRTSSIAIS